MNERASESAKADNDAETALKAVPASESAAGSTTYDLQVLPPLSALLELAAIVAVFLLTDWLWPSLDIHNLQPSVYWLPVLLLTLQYGTMSGSIAAMVAIGATFALSTMPEQGVGENEFTYRLRILAQPILWIGTAVFLGQFRMVQLAAKRELIEHVAKLEEQGRTLSDYASRLRNRCDALEREIVSRQSSPSPRLLVALARLKSSDAASANLIQECLAACFDEGTASIYVRTHAGLRRAFSSNWPPEPKWSDDIPSNHPLFTAVVEQRRSPTVLDEPGEKSLSNEGVAAVPVIDPESGRVSGMIKIEMIRARDLSPALVEALGLLADAVAPRLSDISAAPRLLSGEEKPVQKGSATPIPLRPLTEKLEAQSRASHEDHDVNVSRAPVPIRPKTGL